MSNFMMITELLFIAMFGMAALNPKLKSSYRKLYQRYGFKFTGAVLMIYGMLIAVSYLLYERYDSFAMVYNVAVAAYVGLGIIATIVYLKRRA
jgi:hypothetical protein